jgi:hypothetical protein
LYSFRLSKTNRSISMEVLQSPKALENQPGAAVGRVSVEAAALLSEHDMPGKPVVEHQRSARKVGEQLVVDRPATLNAAVTDPEGFEASGRQAVLRRDGSGAVVKAGLYEASSYDEHAGRSPFQPDASTEAANRIATDGVPPPEPLIRH